MPCLRLCFPGSVKQRDALLQPDEIFRLVCDAVKADDVATVLKYPQTWAQRNADGSAPVHLAALLATPTVLLAMIRAYRETPSVAAAAGPGLFDLIDRQGHSALHWAVIRQPELAPALHELVGSTLCNLQTLTGGTLRNLVNLAASCPMVEGLQLLHDKISGDLFMEMALATNSTGMDALDLAIACNHAPHARLLAGFLEARSKLDTARRVFVCINHGSAMGLQLLLAMDHAGVRKASDARGLGPLPAICRQPSEAAISMLDAWNVRGDADGLDVDPQLPPALMAAVEAGHHSVVEYLLKLPHASAACSSKSPSGFTPLHVAVEVNQAHLVELLLPSTPSLPDKLGRHPLHLAAASGNMQLVNKLINHYMNVNVRGEHGYSALHVACIEGHAHIISILAGHRANANQLDDHGYAPLHLAYRAKQFEVAHALILAGARGDVRSREGKRTPLHTAFLHPPSAPPSATATFKTPVQLVAALLNAPGTDLDAQDDAGNTALHAAVAQGNVPVARFLLEQSKTAAGCILNTLGLAPAHIAVANAQAAALIPLFSSKALCTLSAHGRTAYDLAAAAGNADLAKLIRSHGGLDGVQAAQLGSALTRPVESDVTMTSTLGRDGPGSPRQVHMGGGKTMDAESTTTTATGGVHGPGSHLFSNDTDLVTAYARSHNASRETATHEAGLAADAPLKAAAEVAGAAASTVVVAQVLLDADVDPIAAYMAAAQPPAEKSAQLPVMLEEEDPIAAYLGGNKAPAATEPEPASAAVVTPQVDAVVADDFDPIAAYASANAPAPTPSVIRPSTPPAVLTPQMPQRDGSASFEVIELAALAPSSPSAVAVPATPTRAAIAVAPHSPPSTQRKELESPALIQLPLTGPSLATPTVPHAPSEWVMSDAMTDAVAALIPPEHPMRTVASFPEQLANSPSASGRHEPLPVASSVPATSLGDMGLLDVIAATSLAPAPAPEAGAETVEVQPSAPMELSLPPLAAEALSDINLETTSPRLTHVSTAGHALSVDQLTFGTELKNSVDGGIKGAEPVFTSALVLSSQQPDDESRYFDSLPSPPLQVEPERELVSAGQITTATSDAPQLPGMTQQFGTGSPLGATLPRVIEESAAAATDGEADDDLRMLAEEFGLSEFFDPPTEEAADALGDRPPLPTLTHAATVGSVASQSTDRSFASAAAGDEPTDMSESDADLARMRAKLAELDAEELDLAQDKAWDADAANDESAGDGGGAEDWDPPTNMTVESVTGSVDLLARLEAEEAELMAAMGADEPGGTAALDNGSAGSLPFAAVLADPVSKAGGGGRGGPLTAAAHLRGRGATDDTSTAGSDRVPLRSQR
ncbi:hypothetical protein H9P43_000848 [Blastocladiella emersonii ATCC 22665]|nr:hypothetical protein H9P43_000848 [Blastocladiella emersonii ATCC 22665]